MLNTNGSDMCDLLNMISYSLMPIEKCELVNVQQLRL